MNVWELTQKEYIAFREKGAKTAQHRKVLKPHSVYLHRGSIIEAMNAGLSILPKVLKSYPDLRLAGPQKRSFMKLHKLSKDEWATAHQLKESSRTLDALTRKGLARKRSARSTGWKSMEYRNNGR